MEHPRCASLNEDETRENPVDYLYSSGRDFAGVKGLVRLK